MKASKLLELTRFLRERANLTAPLRAQGQSSFYSEFEGYNKYGLGLTQHSLGRSAFGLNWGFEP
jgi:hypothetical protein